MADQQRSKDSTRRTLIWADDEQSKLLRDVIDAASLQPTAIGSDDDTVAADLASQFDIERVEDLRQAVQREDLDLIWLAGAAPVDADILQIIRKANARAVACEPAPASVHDLLHQPQLAGIVRFVPLMRRSPGYRPAMEVLNDFGRIECINVFLRSGQGQGTLLSRLYDAMDVTHQLCGPAETIMASLYSPFATVPNELAGLTGHMTVNMRFADNRCACVAVSDRAGRWFQGITVLGEGGCLRIDHNSFQWIGHDGSTLDEHKDEGWHTPGDAIASELNRLLERREPIEPPVDSAILLALCEAALLSCRTGQGETPAKMLEMLRRP